MRITATLQELSPGWRMIILVALSTLVNLLHFPPSWLLTWLEEEFPGLAPGEIAYIGWVTATLLTGISLVILVLAVVWVEKPLNIRQFFKLGRIDWLSIVLFLLFLAIMDTLEVLFLRQTFYEPVRLFLISLGLWGQPSLDPGFVPDPGMVWLNLALVFSVMWIEAPEEIFFRGYVQNHLQERIGPNGALLVGAIVWDAWHLFDPAEFVRRLLFALAISLIFHLRQNTTSLAIAHPLSNRFLMILYLISPLGIVSS